MANPERQNFFQIALLVIFGFFAIGGIVLFALYETDDRNVVVTTPVTIWGPYFEDRAFNKLIDEIKRVDKSFENVRYVEKNPATLYGDLLEAIATGNAPDMVLLNSSGLLPLKNKLLPVSFETFPRSTFDDMYVDGADIFILENAIYAYPLLVDPLVMYWNRDIFSNSAIAEIPKDWDTFVQLTPRLSTIVGGADLVQSAVAFGEYDNVLHAKEILSTLFMQTGTSIVSYNGKAYSSELVKERIETKPDLALTFYTSFSNPVKTVYSWNKTFDRSREAFAANKVAMYAGFVSEEHLLREINPNLNFGMSLFPQSKNSFASVTYGDFYGLGILRSSGNSGSALYVASVLAGKNNARRLSELTGLSAVRNDALTEIDVSDPFGHIKVQSAIISRSWLEPAPQSSVDESFRRMVNDVVSGTRSPQEGIQLVSKDIDALLLQYNND